MDEIFYKTNDNYINFHDVYVTNKYEFNIKYWYDMNKKQFIDKIDNYNNKLFYSKCIKIHIYSNNIEDGDINPSLLEYNIDTISIEFTEKITTEKQYYLEHKYSHDLQIVLDDYLNIYLPEINTILIYNYIKFPLYSLFLLNSNIELKDIYSFNKLNKKDMILYTPIEMFKNLIPQYDVSRDKFIDGYIFNGLSEFIEYKKYIEIINPFLHLSKYIQNNSSNENDEDIKINADITKTLNDLNCSIRSHELLLQQIIYNESEINKSINSVYIDNIKHLQRENNNLINKIDSEYKSSCENKFNVNIKDIFIGYFAIQVCAVILFFTIKKN